VLVVGGGVRLPAGRATRRSGPGGGLLLAFVSADGNSAAKQKVTKVVGAALTWTLVARASDNFGTTEIWQAHATGTASGVVTATLGQTGFHASITVAAFGRAAAAAGASATATGNTNHPQVTLTTTALNSLVWTVGHDWTAAARTPASGQVIIHQFVDTAVAHGTCR
jgi:hypothetical protein